MVLLQPSRQGPILVAALLALVAQAEAAPPKQPSATAQSCSLSGQQLGELKGKNPGAMNACGDLANRAAKEGRSFSFMCDAGGKVSCCDDRQCITVVAMKPRIPGGIRPEQLPGTLQQTPTAPGAKQGLAPSPGMNPPVLQRRGVEGEQPISSEKEGK